MADNDSLKLARLEERLSALHRENEQSSVVLRELAEVKNIAEQAKDNASGLGKRIDSLFNRGAVVAVVLASMFAFSWWDAPRKAVSAVDERVAARAAAYIESDDFYTNVQQRLEQDGQQLVLRSGTIDASDWEHYQEGGIKANVLTDLSSITNPRIFVSLSGLGSNWTSNGPSVYPRLGEDGQIIDEFDDQGFSVFIHHSNRSVRPLDDVARDRKWHVDWLVIGSVAQDEVLQ